jgi:hypothetical protein
LASKKRESPDELVARATKALVDQYSSFYTSYRASDSVVLEPDYNLTTILKMVRQDSVAWGAITTLVDRTIEPGWKVRSGEGMRKKDVESFLKDRRFDLWMREVLTQYFVFSNSFGEIVYLPSGGLKELHVIDPTTIRVLTDTHGEVQGYEQRSQGVRVTWQADEVLHVTDPNLGLNVWGEVGLRAVYQAVALKAHIKKFLLWLFETNQFRGIYNPKSADLEAIKRSIAFLKESEKNINKPIIFEGEMDYKLMRQLEGFDQVKGLLYKCDEEILNLLQVPPIYAGLPDNSNRSNSDAQERAFNTRIHSVHKLIEYHVDELLNRTKQFDAYFTFNRIFDTTEEKKVLEVANDMKKLGLTNDVIGDYLEEKGLHLTDDEEDPFNSPEDMLLAAGKLPPVEQEQSEDAPSREPKSTGAGNEKLGTGKRGTTRPDQLVAKTKAFSQYPYVWETEQ